MLKRWLLLLQNIKSVGWETKKINRWEKVWHVFKILPQKGIQMRYLWLLLHSNNCMCTTKTFYQFIGLCLWFTIVMYKTILCVFVFIEQFSISFVPIHISFRFMIYTIMISKYCYRNVFPLKAHHPQNTFFTKSLKINKNFL